MVRTVDHQERRDRILGIVVDQYIKTVTPVSSGFIAQNYRLDLSSATIRNILAELEETGHLTHPHTSAGRLPTQQGYRYYVDNLMHEIHLLEEEKARILAEYKKGVRKLEFLMEKTSEVLSEVTHYTSIISFEGLGSKMICRGTDYVVGYPAAPDLQQIQSILRALEAKEQILELINRDLEKKTRIYIGHEMACAGIDSCSLAVSPFEKKNGPRVRLAVLGPTRMDYEKVVSTLEYVTGLMREIL
jgi:transcriptional regulator of heat shock response